MEFLSPVLSVAEETDLSLALSETLKTGFVALRSKLLESKLDVVS